MRLLKSLQFVLRTLRSPDFECASGERHRIERVLQIVDARGHANDQADEVPTLSCEGVLEHLHEDVDGWVNRFTLGLAPRGNHQTFKALVYEQGLFVKFF